MEKEQAKTFTRKLDLVGQMGTMVSHKKAGIHSSLAATTSSRPIVHEGWSLNWQRKGIPLLFEDNGLVLLQWGKKERPLLIPIWMASSSDLRVRLGDIFFLAQSLSPDLDSTGKTLFAMRPCKEGSLISITASLLCTRNLVAIPGLCPVISSYTINKIKVKSLSQSEGTLLTTQKDGI